MTQAICTNPECIGMGLEEDTAILVTQGGHVEVVGSGLVTVVDGMGITQTNIYDIGNGEPFTAKSLKVHLLRDKDEYDVPSYKRFQLQEPVILFRACLNFGFAGENGKSKVLPK